MGLPNDLLIIWTEKIRDNIRISTFYRDIMLSVVDNFSSWYVICSFCYCIKAKFKGILW